MAIRPELMLSPKMDLSANWNEEGATSQFDGKFPPAGEESVQLVEDPSGEFDTVESVEL
jgi:hypothetical protein